MFEYVKFCIQTSTMDSKILSLLLLVFCMFVNYSDGFSRIKRADIDLQTCIDNFDIHKDKIIRTQDSQNMGAKYLNEIDLGTREECLRLCCETENCDVFVFEEKNSGSCYLFHCGPPEDFKCKFTHHVNYSSAVLAINRHLPDLESQIKLTKHEQDLTKLRKPEIDPEIVPPQASETRTLTSTPSTTTIKSKEVFSVEMKTKPPEEARKCSRYQFECRSTGECIGIYNACDGIPQCADGSDEAPELGCPDSTISIPAPVHLNNPVPPPRYDTNIQQSRVHPLPPALSQPEMYRPQLSQESLGPPQMQPVPHQDGDFLRPAANSRNNVNNRVQFDNPQIPQYVPAPIQLPSNNWPSHQPHQIPPQIPQYTDKNSHIFNHKENGLQVPDGQEISQIPYSDGRDQYNPKISNYYDNYRQPIQQENWANNPVEDQYNGYPQESPNKDWHQENLQNDVRKDGGSYKTTIPDHPFGSNKENPKHEQEKMAHELKHSKENMGHTTSEEATIKIEKHPHNHEHYPDVVAYKIDGTQDLQDGIAETASGAVLSLTLGLILTCIMALLIGCRLRVRRRMKKGGKSYAHDADYLVNGMYL